MTITADTIRNNGIVGAGGAGFPTAVKMKASPEFLILNAAECEPLLHKDMALLEHYPDQVIAGMEQVIQLTGAKSGIIGIKAKNASIIKDLAGRLPASISIMEIGDFYPAGDEVTLVYLCTGRVIQPGELPISQGCVVQNVETIYNIALNKPVVESFLTVAGEVTEPATLAVPIGTSYRDVLSHFEITTAKYIIRNGGLMMGKVEVDLDQVVTKQTGGLILLPSDHSCSETYQRYADPQNTIRIAKSSCDQCNFCTDLCPRYLLGHPVRPELAMRNAMFNNTDNPLTHLGNSFCCECRLCTVFSCPEGLDPAGATTLEKLAAAKNDLHWEPGLPVKAHPMMDYRKVPTKKLKQRLNVCQYQDKGPLKSLNLNPSKVRIPLKQHIGAPASPVVSLGQEVNTYDLIAEATQAISAPVHASIDGKVTVVNDQLIEITRQV